MGVERQLEDCLEQAARRGIAVAEVYEDNDFSAVSRKPAPTPTMR